MNYETKRDVFEAVWNRLDGYQVFFNGWPRETLYDYKKRYDTALPDDLPVVSKDVSNTMRTYRSLCWKEFLDKAYDNELRSYEDINYKVRSESDEVVRAWLLGVWRVEETGEIVKAEAEK